MKPEKRVFRASLLSISTIITMNTLGSYVSAMEAGMACPDWPLCPFPETLPVILEFAHRVWGLAVIGSVAYVAFVARGLRGLALYRPARLIAYFSLLLLSIQIGLGAMVIFTYLMPELVALHQLIAQTLLSLQAVIAGLSWTASMLRREEPQALQQSGPASA
jgi:cytochrome c oxidase assembly protein subunit 15